MSPQPESWLNIGGGFGVPCFLDEARLELGPIADNLATLAKETGNRLPEAEFVMELGRYLVAEAGFYVCEIVGKKGLPGRGLS